MSVNEKKNTSSLQRNFQYSKDTLQLYTVIIEVIKEKGVYAQKVN